MHEPFYVKNQQWPHRLLLRDGGHFYRILDLQIVREANHGLSLYLKPPSEHVYEATKPMFKIKTPSWSTKVTIDFTQPHNAPKCFNPYLSWHSSGRLHTNAYRTRNLKKEIILQDSKAISLEDIAAYPHIIFSATIPVSTLSHPLTAPPPLDFAGNYFEISANPYLPRTLSKGTTLNLVLDRTAIRQGYLVLDVMIHGSGTDIDIDKNLPYPENSEFYFVDYPITFTDKDPARPAITLFFYQPCGPTEILLEKSPTTYWGRSLGAVADQVYQTTLIG